MQSRKGDREQKASRAARRAAHDDVTPQPDWGSFSNRSQCTAWRPGEGHYHGPSGAPPTARHLRHALRARRFGGEAQRGAAGARRGEPGRAARPSPSRDLLETLDVVYLRRVHSGTRFNLNASWRAPQRGPRAPCTRGTVPERRATISRQPPAAMTRVTSYKRGH